MQKWIERDRIMLSEAVDFKSALKCCRTERNGYAPPANQTLYPPLRPGLVPRPRLTERLNEGIRRRLTLISAPAGFGKTTLLSEWMADFRFPISDFGLMPAADHAGEKPESEIVQLSAHDQVRNQKSKIRVAWVSLDEDDNDPARFWGYVITALQTPHAGMGENALASFRSPQHPPGAPASRSVTPGRRRDERAIYEQALELTVDGQERPLPVAGMAWGSCCVSGMIWRPRRAVSQKASS